MHNLQWFMYYNILAFVAVPFLLQPGPVGEEMGQGTVGNGDFLLLRIFFSYFQKDRFMER